LPIKGIFPPCFLTANHCGQGIKLPSVGQPADFCLEFATEPPDLTPQLHSVLTAFAYPQFEMQQIRIDDARRWCAEHALGKDLGTGVFAHGGVGKAGCFADGTQSFASEMTSTHLIVSGLTPGTAIGRDLASRAGSHERLGPSSGVAVDSRYGQKPLQSGIRACRPSFGHLPRVAEQVPSIGDLDRGRCTSSDRASIRSRAVPRDEADPRPGLKPGGQRFGIAIGQQVNRPPTLEIDDDRAVARAFPQCPVVDADDRRRGGSGNGRRPDQPGSVSPLVGMPSWWAKRLPASPPSATPTCVCAWASRRVRLDRCASSIGRRSANVRRRHAGLMQT